MYLVIGRFSESVEGIKMFRCENDKDLQEFLQHPPVNVPQGIRYRNEFQFDAMENEPYYWDVGEAVVLKVDVLSHIKRLRIMGLPPYELGQFHPEVREDDLIGA